MHTISEAATSITAFVGATPQGPENQPVRLFSFADYERCFGGLASGSELSYAVQQFFANGGSDAYVVRVTKGTGENGGLPGTGELIGDAADFTGIHALRNVEEFNLLCIPEATRAAADDPSRLDGDLDPNQIFDEAMTLCIERRAFLLIDPPPGTSTPERASDWKTSGLTVQAANGAAFFPRLRLADPLSLSPLRTFAPCGAVAGVYSRIDGLHGVWKAPAGADAGLSGVQELAYELGAAESAALEILGLNCLRSFPVHGKVIWGARTLVGADGEASEWKYVPVRRLALFLEQSISRGTQWAVFEPNDETLWARLRLEVGAFLHATFRRGAFAGRSAREAYVVRCDSTTTTQDDIDRGIVNVVVGFAPLKPAEFVFIRIQQLAGQART